MQVSRAPPHPAMANESPAATPTFCHTARPSSSSSVISIASAVPSLTSSSDFSVTSLKPIAPEDGWFYTPSMHQLDSNAYPTRALYYLHKRMLEVALHPGSYHNQPWSLQIRPGTPVPSSALVQDGDQGTVAPENSLEESGILNVLGEVKQVRSMEEDLVLHNLCATLVSAEYISPPTPPTGATPCGTPPKFEAPTFTTHEGYACHIAMMLVSNGVTELDDHIIEEFEVEMECGATWVSGSCPCVQDENKKTLLEEMETCASKTPRETKQARRRARNSLKCVALGGIVEAF
ncbi:hypothetical protein OPQ81_005882 [Rhizoctonia solani]|nr:hypothetical protein OPQ81_005882 [Rhizoctonia solani]